jgi:hypothetical protein
MHADHVALREQFLQARCLLRIAAPQLVDDVVAQHAHAERLGERR